MFTFLYADLFTSFKYLNTMALLVITNSVTREVSKNIFQATLTPSFINFDYT